MNITENEKRNIVRLWETGVAISNIVKMLPYSQKDSKKIISDLREQGILTADTRGSWKKKVINAYNSGITNPYEMAEQLGYKVTSIRTMLVALKLHHDRPQHNYKVRTTEELSEKTQQIISDLQQGKTTTQIRLDRNVSRQYIWDIRNKYINK